MSLPDLSQYLSEASIAAMTIAKYVPLRLALLSDWRGVRLIYDTPFVNQCPLYSCAPRCPLFLHARVDRVDLDGSTFRSSLFPASAEDLRLFPARQRMLNCKTFLQTADSFGAWMRDRCYSRKDVEEEFEYIIQLRIAYPSLLLSDRLLAEGRLRRKVVRRCLAATVGLAQHNWVQEVARDLGIL